jgi:hypothetical protein
MGDSRDTVSFDENSHLVLFPSFSWYITLFMGNISHMASGGI